MAVALLLASIMVANVIPGMLLDDKVDAVTASVVPDSKAGTPGITC